MKFEQFRDSSCQASIPNERQRKVLLKRLLEGRYLLSLSRIGLLDPPDALNTM